MGWVGGQFDMSEKHDEILSEIAIEEREQEIELQLRIFCITLIAVVSFLCIEIKWNFKQQTTC